MIPQPDFHRLSPYLWKFPRSVYPPTTGPGWRVANIHQGYDRPMGGVQPPVAVVKG
jgi:hypothetical protein